MTAYNGLNHCEPFNVTLVKKGSNPEQTFEFVLPNSLQDQDCPFCDQKFLPNDSNYTIQAFTVNCQNHKVTFEDMDFEPLEVDEDEVQSMHIFITSNPDDSKTGLIDVGDHLDPLDKSQDGLPQIKY